MTNPREGAACAVLLFAATSLNAGERPVAVTIPGGVRDTTASVACIDPASPSVPVDPRHRAAVPEGCRRVRCESLRWLPGVSAIGASGTVVCALQPAVQLAVELPQDAGGALVVSVRSPGAKEAAFETVSHPRSQGPRPPLTSPPLAPGRYDLAVGRPDGSWTCRAAMRFAAPEPVSVFAPWRDGLVVGGRVTSADGRALVGVPVTTSAEGAPPSFKGPPAPPDRGGVWRCAGAAATEARSDADGAFRVRVDPQAETLVVAGGWDDPRGIDFVSRRGARAERLRLVPAVPHRAVARVLDADDRPVACRARLLIENPDEGWAARVAPGGPKEAACTPEGRLRVGPFRADVFQVDLRSDEALPLRVPGSAAPGVPETDLGVVRVERGTWLRVVVSDDARAPVRGAEVVVASREGLVMERSGRTGVDGIARIAGLPAETSVRVTVEARGFGRAVRDGVATGGDVEIRVTRTGGVRGRVTTESGAPIRARVSATTPDGAPIAETEADESGSFSFLTLPAGVALLRASARGYRPSEPTRVVPAADDAAEPVVLLVRETTSLRGKVLDVQRTPLPGATVLIFPGVALPEHPESAALAATRATHDGGFTIDATGSPGETVVALATGYAPVSARAAGIAADSEIELLVRPEARMLVRLPRSFPGDATMVVTDTSGLTRVITAHSRREILIGGLAPGEAYVALRPGPTKPVRLIAGETVSVDLSVGARIRGTVRHQGRPQARAAVTVAAVDPGGLSAGDGALTGADGGFVLDGVGPGEHVLVAIAGRGRVEKRLVVPEDGELDVDLDLAVHGLRVAVRAKGESSPVPGALLTAVPRGASCTAFGEAAEVEDGVGWVVSLSNGGCARATSGSDGSASFVLGGAGPHVVSVEAAGFAPWTGAVEIVEGMSEVVAELKRGGPPIVRVSIDTDPPGVAGSIYCVQAGRSVSRGPVAGEATCEGLAPGPADVAFRAADFGLARATVEIPEAGELAVTLRVARGGVLVAPLAEGAATNVRVVDDRGVVWNRPYGLGWPRCGVEERDGVGRAYVCRELPPGAYAAEVDGRRRPSVVVRGGEVAVAY